MTDTTDLSRPATSSDVARLAGVSRSTVSRILNGDEQPFPEATRRRVHDAATKLSYRPSGAARSLVRGESDTIVIVTPDTRFGSHLQDSVDEVAAQTRRYGGNVVVRVAGEDGESTLSALLGLRPFAVLNFGVLSVADAASLKARGVLVVPDSTTRDDATSSDPGIARLQAAALRRNGERPIWYALPRDTRPEPYSEERFVALQQYCAAEGLELPRIVPVDLTVQGGIDALAHILRASEEAAIACYNDEVALTLLAGARETGVDVPGKVAVIGMDDTTAARLWSPRLTTVHVDMHAFIETLVAELRDHLEGGSGAVGAADRDLFTLIDGETA